MDKEGPITVMAIIFMILIAGVMVFGMVKNAGYSVNDQQASLDIKPSITN